MEMISAEALLEVRLMPNEKQKPTTNGYKANYDRIDWSIKPVRDEREGVIVAKSRIGFPQISSDYKAYECPVTGKMIEGRVAHRENLKRTGCRLNEKGEFADVKKNGKKYMYDKIDAAVDRCVDEIANQI